MIYNIQRYSLHDGSGLRTTVFLKGCPLCCTWCSNPESQKYSCELTWDSNHCMGCRDCVKISAEGSMQEIDGKITFFPKCKIDLENYRDICPTKALEVIGEKKTADEILQEIFKDNVFYRNNGGVTLSGGEPLMQPQLCKDIALGVKKDGITLDIETCLHVPWENIEMLVPWVDEFLCDTKHVDNDVFLNQTGGNLELVWENLEKLSNTGAKIRARIPIINGFNHDIKTIKAILKRIEKLDAVYAVDFLPYHPLGAGKYKNLGRSYSHPSKAMQETEIQEYIKLAEKMKLKATIGG